MTKDTTISVFVEHTTGAAVVVRFANTSLLSNNPSIAQKEGHFAKRLILMITAGLLACPTSAAFMIAETAGCNVPVAKFL